MPQSPDASRLMWKTSCTTYVLKFYLDNLFPQGVPELFPACRLHGRLQTRTAALPSTRCVPVPIDSYCCSGSSWKANGNTAVSSATSSFPSDSSGAYKAALLTGRPTSLPSQILLNHKGKISIFKVALPSYCSALVLLPNTMFSFTSIRALMYSCYPTKTDSPFLSPSFSEN